MWKSHNLPTRCVCNRLWTSCNTTVISSSCYWLVAVNLVAMFYVQAISDLLEQLLFLSDEGPMLETLDHTIRIGSTPTFLYFRFVIIRFISLMKLSTLLQDANNLYQFVKQQRTSSVNASWYELDHRQHCTPSTHRLEVFIFTVNVVFIISIGILTWAGQFFSCVWSSCVCSHLCLLRYISNARLTISSFSFSLQMQLFPDTITEFSRVSWLMERHLSDKIFVRKLKVHSTEEFDPDMLIMIREASAHRFGNSMITNSASITHTKMQPEMPICVCRLIHFTAKVFNK